MRSAIRYIVLAAFTVACGDSTGLDGTALAPGQSRTVSGNQGAQRLFRISVPTGTGHLRVQLRGGEGDADLVLRRGAPPETGLYDCVSEARATTEECLIDAPNAGTWYILVVGHAAYDQVRLIADLGTVIVPAPLQSGVAVTEVSGSAGAFRMFAVQVPTGATHLDVEFKDASGDADLFIRHAAHPSLTNYDCVSFSATSNERCGQWNPTPGTWYVRLEGFTAYAGGTLRATVSAAALGAVR